ncbi:MAG: hypothetical protein EZS28_021776 [Streblomastix strix]|uniref:Uncharacterized protein n=1 Tax=Streblomastix strix TaxID=222440 RepID=A0A5J4VJS5_9EUKA|nr:MAG: hypothetical protein EZS28_021776 [Streblomastix strix]
MDALALADRRTYSMLQFFTNEISMQRNKNRDDSIINEEYTQSILLDRAERAENLPLFKNIIELYQSRCGIPDDYSRIPHLKMLANVCNEHILDMEDAQLRFELELEQYICRV